MLVELHLPFADVRARDLSLTLGREPLPALEFLRARVGGIEVELRLLGCSHQALVADLLSETVACTPGVPGDLPSQRADGLAGGVRYDFRAHVKELAPAAYARAARAAIAAARDDAHGLVGLFPAPLPGRGSGDAFTALRLAPLAGGVGWQTWHGYPQTGELVITETELVSAR